MVLKYAHLQSTQNYFQSRVKKAQNVITRYFHGHVMRLIGTMFDGLLNYLVQRWEGPISEHAPDDK